MPTRLLIPLVMREEPTDFKSGTRDGEVPSEKKLSSYFEELFSSKVPCQKELSSSNEELFPNPERHGVTNFRNRAGE